MYQKTFYATHPASINGSTNEDLREHYLISELFAADKIHLNYTHFERMVIGGVFPAGLNERRLEIYLYFDLDEKSCAMHFMGQPETTRHIVIGNE